MENSELVSLCNQSSMAEAEWEAMDEPARLNSVETQASAPEMFFACNK